MNRAVRLDDEGDVYRAQRDYDLPYDPDHETPDTYIGTSVVHVDRTGFQPRGNEFELRPFERCPHCDSYSYHLRWVSEDVAVSMALDERSWYECDRCELRRPHPDPAAEEGEDG